MNVAVFDLDHTILEGDSDVLFGHFLVEKQIVAPSFLEGVAKYSQDYHEGDLDINEYLRYMFRAMTTISPEQHQELTNEFLTEKIQPIIRPAMLERIRWHEQNGDKVLILSATNLLIITPIAHHLGVQHVLGSVPERINGRYTGEVEGIPCFRDGKVVAFQNWLHTHRYSVAESWFYSDSHNDIPLLSEVTHPIVVTPDAQLSDHAQRHGWLEYSI